MAIMKGDKLTNEKDKLSLCGVKNRVFADLTECRILGLDKLSTLSLIKV